jgi:hypothetical protein
MDKRPPPRPKSPLTGAPPCEHCGGENVHGSGHALRCACGSLLGRVAVGGLEVKCRRCRRIIILALTKGIQM